ncbi:MAG: hypothetical protein C5B46_06530 [Proteobacteria bacterium]|nr:MAG: hypothetical protein C5B46_06530 [Pseudomonadota bacterium]
MPTLFRDLRYAARQLRKTPGFSLTVVLTLALGIGATTAIFSIIEGVLLRPLPYKDPDRLVLLGDHIGDSPHMPVTAREIGTYAKAAGAFSSMGGFSTTGYELSGGAAPERVDAARLNAGVFTTLGVQPILGRVFTQQEEDSHQPLTVISYSLWLERFHRDPGVVGSSISLDRKTYSVIGVLPRGFEFPIEQGSLNPIRLWVPLSLTTAELSDQDAGNWGYHIVARLKDGVALRQAAEDAERVSREIMRSFPPKLAAIYIRGDVIPLRNFYLADARPLLRILFVAVAAVLLGACVNVAGLLLVRAIHRRRDYALRLAVGARSGAIVRESVFEGALLSAMGGLLGLGLVSAAIRSAPHLLPESMPRVDSVRMDPVIAAFAIFLALATGALCSLAPAFAALKTNLTEGLREGTKTASGSSTHAWLRSALVVAEIAIALVLLNTCGAFLRSYEKMLAVDPGFRPDHVLVARYQLPLLQYSIETSAEAFNHAVIDRLSGRPGVVAVGIGMTIPGSGLIGGADYTIEGEPLNQWKLKFAMFNLIEGDYFRAFNIPLLEGRTFTPDDRAGATPVIIINESLAKRWPGQSAIGRRMHIGNPNSGLPWVTVVGVVAGTKGGPRDQPSGEQWYTPVQQPQSLFGSDFKEQLSHSAGGFIVLRSTFPPGQMTQTLRSTVAEIDPHLALQQIEPMNDVMAGVEAPRRFNTGLVTIFALAALLLCVSGIYAVVAFSVSMRAQEIAIRLALGAQRGNIARLVLLSGFKLGIIGCCLGIFGSFAAARLIKSFLFGVTATDPLIYIAGVASVLCMVLLASALPAARAAASDPICALRAI